MEILDKKDLFEVHLSSLLADYDRDVITNLYQPIIGHEAVMLFFSFWSEASNQKVLLYTVHESFLLRTHFSISEFLKARKLLEGIGLLKTYLEDKNNAKFYHYELYSPKNPYSFFEDTLLKGLLIKNVGEEISNRLKSIYANTSTDIDKNLEITASFKEVFNPNLDDEVFFQDLNTRTPIGRRKAKIDLGFDLKEFFASLASFTQIGEKSLSSKEIKEIMRLSSLYGVNEIDASSAVSRNYDFSKPKGSRLDLVSLNNELQELNNYNFLTRTKYTSTSNELTSDSDLSKKINIMEKLAPKNYLTLLQNGIKPIKSDLDLINNLSKRFKLANGVINVIIDYTLSMNNNILSTKYVEKIASSMVREKITTALDAMNYLLSNQSKYTSSNATNPNVTQTVSNSVTNNNDTSSEDEEALDWYEVLSKIK